MKTLFIIAKKMNKPTDEVIRKLEKQDQFPRVSLLERELNMQLLDERYLDRIPKWRKIIYKFMPTELTQVLEASLVCKHYDAVVSYYERVALPFALLQRVLNSNTPHILMTTWLSSKEKVWFLKKVHFSLAKILTWSSNQRDYAVHKIGIPPNKIRLLKRGVDQRFWRDMHVKTDMICSAGMEMRDYPTLVSALKSLDIPCHIAVAEEARGQIYETVQRLKTIEDIDANITIGRKSILEMRELYARSRFVVVPLLQTDTDNGLTVILEAMSMGKAVICSKVEGQIDVIQDGVTGIFVPQGNPEALRNAILDLWENPEKANRIGKAARKYVEEVHNLEQFVYSIKEEVEKAVYGVQTASSSSKQIGIEA